MYVIHVAVKLLGSFGSLRPTTEMLMCGHLKRNNATDERPLTASAWLTFQRLSLWYTQAAMRHLSEALGLFLLGPS